MYEAVSAPRAGFAVAESSFGPPPVRGLSLAEGL